MVNEPKIVDFGPVKVAGLLHKTSHSNNTIPAFWQSVFEDGRHSNLHGQDWVASHGDFGICIEYAENPDAMDYLLGLAVKDGANVPDEFVQTDVAAGQYATLTSTVEEIGPTWGRFEAWLAKNGEYVADMSRHSFEYYKCECVGDVQCEACATGTMICELYLAIKSK